MRKGKLWSFALIMLLVLSTALAACSGGDDKEGSGDKDKDAADKGGSENKTLVFGRGGDSTSLDPSRVTEGETFKVTVNLFETLLNFGEQDTTVQPGLAKEYDTSEDGLTYTFQLEEGVKFHDGTDFNAEAVVKNFERWANGDSDTFPYYNSMFGGFKDDEDHVIESVKADGESTVIITLKRPQAPFLKNLAMSMFAISSPEAFEKGDDEYERNPVGTGPFKFVEWKPNETITIEKNEEYWQEGLPKLDRIIFQAIPDNSARLNALLSGEIDLADGINPADGVKIEDNDTLQLFERPSMNVGYLGLTVTREPFDKKEVRQAMNYAIDKQSIVDSFFEGRAEVAKNAMPSSISGYNDDVEDYAYDPEKAKELLKEAGLEDGFEMELWAMPVPRPYMPDGTKVAEAIQSNLADVGIKAKIVSYEWATYLDKASKGEADAFMLGWTGDNGDADNFLYVLLDEDNIGSNNYTYFKNDETHKLFLEAQTEVDEDKRIELYKQAQEILHEEAPWVPLAHSIPLLGGAKELTGFVPHPTGSDLLSNVEFK
ncbi:MULTISPECIES: ABC transporter substrate-binding protein [unclassified Sporosarcina]|uniref:ABC transporter substrate-binding protein n=1 Tax=unclassified Sporosarcina TaxID=2647733 RepID=UPI000C1705DD|nr:MULTISPECIES: ABC transporter substrate-binding protein [unclassified Sporosarcina]PID05149.1 ABC transporter substrate-binding protein [Sporosarcina sp. P30]PID08347.1 ABC transporter substrate-binding protein [Sporosarcina sp. P31]PID11435.1 ABC transporter substrate-binding protein [Sporosarcina sp. P32b]